MIEPGRNYSVANTNYRYGFNGKELDKETSSTTTYDYGFRIYSPALGKFLSVDPLTGKYPWYTPYQFAGNTPIQALDMDGQEGFHYTLSFNNNGSTTLHLDNVKYVNHHTIFGFKFWPDTKIEGQRAIVNYQSHEYYIGFKGSYGRGNENKFPLFQEFTKAPEAKNFPKLFFNEDQSYSTEFATMAIEMQNNAVMYGQLTEEAWYTRTLEDSKTSTVYRTQGGELPNASRERISINQGGDISISGDDMLYVTINDKAHQVYFYQKRGGAGKGAEIVSFEIPQSLADEIVANGIPQAQAKANPGKPQISDPTQSNSAYGLPKTFVEKLRRQAIKGTGKIEKPPTQ